MWVGGKGSQQNQKRKKVSMVLWYLKDVELNVTQKGKNTFHVIHKYERLYICKKYTSLEKEDLGFTLGIVADVASGIVPEVCNRLTLVF